MKAVCLPDVLPTLQGRLESRSFHRETAAPLCERGEGVVGAITASLSAVCAHQHSQAGAEAQTPPGQM